MSDSEAQSDKNVSRETLLASVLMAFFYSDWLEISAIAPKECKFGYLR